MKQHQEGEPEERDGCSVVAGWALPAGVVVLVILALIRGVVEIFS